MSETLDFWLAVIFVVGCTIATPPLFYFLGRDIFDWQFSFRELLFGQSKEVKEIEEVNYDFDSREPINQCKPHKSLVCSCFVQYVPENYPKARKMPDWK